MGYFSSAIFKWNRTHNIIFYFLRTEMYASTMEIRRFRSRDPTMDRCQLLRRHKFIVNNAYQVGIIDPTTILPSTTNQLSRIWTFKLQIYVYYLYLVFIGVHSLVLSPYSVVVEYKITYSKTGKLYLLLQLWMSQKNTSKTI